MRRQAGAALGDRGDVLGRRAAAAADDRDAVALDELAERLGERLGLLGEDRLAVGALERQAGVRDAVDRAGCECSPRKRIASRMSSGPVEQFRPITSTFSASSVVSTASMSVPSSILPPLGSSETEHWIGTARPVALNASRAPKIAALTSRMSCAVSMMSRSAPPWTSPRACSSKIATSSGKRISPSVGVVGGGEVPGRADRAGDEEVLADRAARDLAALHVDLERVLAEAPLLELQAAGLEGVGLDDLGAGGDHRRVHALDDVGAVEHERLVALAGEPAVVLGGEVELLERRAHAAVEDDDALADGGEVVTRHSPQASRNFRQP